MKSFREIIADIKKGEFAPVYILMGREPYYLNVISDLLEQTVVENEEDKIFDQTVLYGADSDVGNLIEAANRFSMTGGKQLVMLKEAQAMNRVKTQFESLKGYFEKPNPNTVMVIVHKGDKLPGTSGFMKTAAKNKDIVIFDSPAIRDYNLPQVVKDYCVGEGIKISDKAVQLLTEHVGNSLEKLFSEIEKLIVAQKGEKHITPESIEKNIGISKDYNNFELTTAIANRDYYAAMNIVSRFAQNGKAHPTVVTTPILFNFFQRVLIAQNTADKSDASLMGALQLKSAYPLKEIKTGMRNYTGLQCEKAIHVLREFDTKSKGINSYQKEFDLLLDLAFNLLTL